MQASVEPGVFFRDFDKETQKQNLELPSYTASRELNTVGGMVANNSGGEKNLKYGKTARYVEELDVVLSDGHVHTLKRLEGDALRRKLAEESFEGELYRRVANIVSTPEHKKIIDAAKPVVEKNSSGYALWDIGDGTTSLNLARLMVGSQGHTWHCDQNTVQSRAPDAVRLDGRHVPRLALRARRNCA